MPPERVSSIQVSFAVPVAVPDAWFKRLAELIDEIARASTPDGHVHWLSEYGSKPLLSQADARVLGKPVNPAAPESGEPTFDDSVLVFETYCRRLHAEGILELAHRLERAVAGGDEQRMNLLETLVVNVRQPVRHGSYSLWTSGPTGEDADTNAAPSNLRAKIDEYVAAPYPGSRNANAQGAAPLSTQKEPRV